MSEAGEKFLELFDPSCSNSDLRLGTGSKANLNCNNYETHIPLICRLKHRKVLHLQPWFHRTFCIFKRRSVTARARFWTILIVLRDGDDPLAASSIYKTAFVIYSIIILDALLNAAVFGMMIAGNEPSSVLPKDLKFVFP